MTDPFAQAQKEADERADFDLRRYLDLLLRHRKLVVGCVTVSCAVAFLVAYLATPEYEASTTISVEQDAVSLSDLGVGGPQLLRNDPGFLPTQARIISGRDVLGLVVDQRSLGKEARRSGEKRDADAETEAQLARQRAIHELAKRVHVRVVVGTNLIEVASLSTSPREAAETANAVAEAYLSWSKRARTGQMSQLSRFLAAQIEGLKKDVEEKERKLAELGKTREFVPVDPSSSVATQKLEAFNKDYAAAAADRIGKEARYQQVMAMRPEEIAEQDPAVAVARAEQQKLEREYAEKLSIWKPDFPAMKQLKARIEKGQKYLETTSREAAEKARDRARVDVDAARKREDVLRGMVRSQSVEALGQNIGSIEFANIRTEISASRALLDSMLRKQAETEVAARVQGQREPNIRVVEVAFPPEFRSYPSYRKNLQYGLLAGVLLGVGLVFLIDRLDRSIRTQEQVEQILKLPALGLIPAVGASEGVGGLYGLFRYGYGYSGGYSYRYGSRKKRKAKAESAAPAPKTDEEKVSVELIPHNRPRSPISEAYRALRALLLVSRAGGLRTVVITSALPGEGKTTTAANLAVTIAQLGKKVLLVDVDLHKPRQHEVFKVSNRAGLVSILVEGSARKDVLLQTAVPNLWLITAGPVTPNPSALLASDAMKTFLADAVERFDFVILDSPPVQPVADALILGAFTDGVILTIRGGQTPREAVQKAAARLSRANVRVLGALINNLKLGPAQRAGYGTARKYDYGYGYSTDYLSAREHEASSASGEGQRTSQAG